MNDFGRVGGVYTDIPEGILPPLPDVDGGPPTPQMAPVPPPYAHSGYGQMPRPLHGIPQFYIESRKTADGQFINVEMIRILTPGDNKATPEHKMTDALREKYRPWYDRWKKGLTETTSGVPLEMWAALTPAQVHHLKSMNIFSVEQLAEVADNLLHNIPMGLTLRIKAREYIKLKKDSDLVEAYQHEKALLNDTISQQQDMLRSMQAQIDAMNAKLEKQTAEDLPNPVKKKG